MNIKSRPTFPRLNGKRTLWACVLLTGLCAVGVVQAEEKKDLIETPLIKKHKAEMAAAAAIPEAPASAAVAPEPPVKHGSTAVQQLRSALSVIGTRSKPVSTEMDAKSAEAAVEKPVVHMAAKRRMPAPAPAEEPQNSRQYAKERAPTLAQGEHAGHTGAAGADGHVGEVHWAYEGDNGPQNWATLKPEFNLCGIGKRQSPIAIQADATLQGPAEALQFNYMPSRGTMVNNGHTLQVDVAGENTVAVRGSSYKLLQFHFHTPSEEMVNSKRYTMVAHLVHKNDAGQLAVVAVLLELGEANAFIDKVWTYMPLDTNDRVRMPDGLLDLNEILPKDQRYYQFMGSLTTPPCSEGVLWMVLKQPVKISAAQYKVFRQQFPFNARPVQPLNGRPVREAQ